MLKSRVTVFFGLFLCVISVTTALRDAAAETPESVDYPLEEVVVTAMLRPVKLQDVAASITIIDARTLREAGLQHLEDVLLLVPNLNWASGTSRPRYFQLRGIGETDQWQGAPNPSVGFLFDGMDFSGIGMPATLIDLGQVEVLRGPQGTTLGANALAGLINVSSVAPRAEPALALTGSFGEAGVGSIGLVAGGELTGESTWRAVAERHRADGSRRNLHLARDDTNGLAEDTLRWRSRHALGERWSADVSLLHVDQDNGFDAFAIDNSRNTVSDDPGSDRQRSRGASLILERVGQWRFRSLTSLVDADIGYAFDGDWGHDPEYDFTSRFLRDRRVLSQDFRLLSSDDTGRAGQSWVLGLYAMRVREANDQLDLYGGEVYRALVSDYLADHRALYGTLELPLAVKWGLTVGARLEHRSADYQDSDGSFVTPSETMWGGNLALRYLWDANRSAYLGLARGYKAGGFNIGTVIPVDRREFSAELLHSLELGYKHENIERSRRFEATLFYMRRADQQVSTSAQLDPGDPLSFIYLTDNAARGENFGLEAAITQRLTQRWSLAATAGLLRSRFLDYSVDDRDLSGRAQAHAPEQQFSFTADYRHESGWFARADLQYVAAFYFSDSHEQRSRAYRLLNARIGYAAERWRVDAWLRNALDENYAQRGFFFGNEPPDFPDKLYLQLAEPRRAGVNFTWNLQ